MGVRIPHPQQSMRSKEWSPAVEERRIAKRRRRTAKRAMAKLMASLTLPGCFGCPGFVTITFIPDSELDRLGIWIRNKIVIVGLKENNEIRNDL